MFGIEIADVKFIPLSQSRCSNEVHPNVNYRLSLTKGGRTLEIDWSEGIGHYNLKTNSRGNYYAVDVENLVEYGTTKTTLNARPNLHPAFKVKPKSPLEEILCCLQFDWEVINYSFEEWADNFGYDSDSRSAEKIYNQCLQSAQNAIQSWGLDTVQAILNSEELAEL